MSKEVNSSKVKALHINNLDLPNFITNSSISNTEVFPVEGTNVIRVPFGKRLSKKKRPQKNQSIATLILPISSFNSPTPPPYVA